MAKVYTFPDNTGTFKVIDGELHFLDYFSKLTLVGVDFGKSNHYWGNHNISDVPGNHEWDKEEKYINSLVKQNKIEVI